MNKDSITTISIDREGKIIGYRPSYQECLVIGIQKLQKNSVQRIIFSHYPLRTTNLSFKFHR